ncbi:hypothetical protein A3F55_02575 [Candidatus Adlerbacteria bacterium RIFCSPHIGHO2_12_FULL_53_18]|uniref:Uncharacterized protein n=1 Tax=Candidatus Adlerbacteria bacterium RIFCSPHIGHO2_12_FULL_53_18 TaxID=1797242 RepID=A0A1F4XSJ9_9BACT|nr:MAG: hypothetical protein A3F55_02575 [Candidatus Adlerbacteria bacterium RIFCSPHIGHO2_12_FULL_53_18]
MNFQLLDFSSIVNIVSFSFILIAVIGLSITAIRNRRKGIKNNFGEKYEEFAELYTSPMDMFLGRKKMPLSLAFSLAIGLSLFTILSFLLIIRVYVTGGSVASSIWFYLLADIAFTGASIFVLVKNLRN